MNKKILLSLTLSLLCTSSIFAADGKKRKAEKHPEAPVAQTSKVDQKTNYQKEFIKACLEKNIDTVKNLINHPNVNVNQKIILPSGTTITPLGIGCQLGNIAVIQVLLSNQNTNRNQGKTFTNGSTITPLGISCKLGNIAVIKVLLSNQNINRNQGTTFINGSTITPLGITCFNNHTETLQLLLSDPRIDLTQGSENANGITITPLGIACKSGSTETVQFLLNKGASCKKVTSNEKNAYQIAKTPEIKKLIQEHIIKQQISDPVSIENFRKNEHLHFLECCSSFIPLHTFYQIKLKIAENTIQILEDREEEDLPVDPTCPLCREDLSEEANEFVCLQDYYDNNALPIDL
jgi:ankyrin repeat protein